MSRKISPASPRCLLPHDYLNFWLTGEKAMEYGDASGTALLEVRKRKWSAQVLEAIDPGLAAKLPPLIASDQPAGALQDSTAQATSACNPGILVSAGGGDNMMGAIGTGNTRPGVITASFGTSGTIYACAEKPVIDPRGEIAAFCDSTNRWLPLLCTMNVTVATEMVREDFGWSHEQFAAEAGQGSRRLATACSCFPYLEGERTPNVPDGTGVWFGANRKTFTAAHFARAAMEGVTLGMNYGLRRLRELGVKPTPNPRHRRRRQIQSLAPNHGRRIRRRGRHSQGWRRRRLRRRFAGPLVLASAARANAPPIHEITANLWA